MSSANKFRKLASFSYKDKKFVMFINDNQKLAFLNIDEKGKFHYPTLDELIFFNYSLDGSKKEGIYEIRKDTKKYNFTPKFIRGGIAVVLTSAILGAINLSDISLSKETDSSISIESEYKREHRAHEKSDNVKNNTYVKETKSTKKSNNSTLVNSNSENSYLKSVEKPKTNYYAKSSTETNSTEGYTYLKPIEFDGIYYDDFENNINNLLAPADDELDFRWKNDYEEISGKYFFVRDSKAYGEVFEINKPTFNQLKSVVEGNDKISRKYKDFILNYISDYLRLYPETNFAPFYENLKTLEIVECSDDDIKWASISATAIACYRSLENRIFVNNKIDISQKESDDYIVLSHELTHAARTLKLEKDNRQINTAFYKEASLGSYTDEALDTHFMHQLRGDGSRAEHYTLASSYIRIILSCLGNNYTGSDYMNHSVNYFISEMDKFMGDNNAEHIIALMESQMALHYNKYVETDLTNFEELFEYLTRMYMKKNLKANMSYSEASELFDKFYGEITYNFDNLEVPYPEVTEDKFRTEFEKILDTMGISKGLTR